MERRPAPHKVCSARCPYYWTVESWWETLSDEDLLPRLLKEAGKEITLEEKQNLLDGKWGLHFNLFLPGHDGLKWIIMTFTDPNNEKGTVGVTLSNLRTTSFHMVSEEDCLVLGW